jgi:preprotein translocase subunit SecG
MFTVLLVVHVLVTLALIGSVLIQRSEGGGLGIGGAQGMGSFMTGRGTANLLTRTTAGLATVFLALSLVLALMSRGNSGGANSIFSAPPPISTAATPAIPAAPASKAAKAAPAAPSVPTTPAAPSTP